MYSPSSLSTSCFGFVAGPSVCLLLAAHTLAILCDLPDVEIADPNFSFASPVDFLNPTFRRRNSGQPTPDALDVGSGASLRLAVSALAPSSGLPQLAMTAIYTVLRNRANAKWVGKWVGCSCGKNP